ncbi:sensor histidine kinase [Thauera sp.]|uniref:sensor histidine kinase n=1 Tax=Thauera sp. TaxID=1905334 RepID=UPI0039E5962A
MARHIGLGGRLLLIGIAATMLVSAAGGWMLRQKVHDTLYNGMVLRLQDHADRIGANFVSGTDGGLAQGQYRGTDEFGRIFSGWYWQLEDGPRLLRSRSLWDSRLETARALPSRHGDSLLNLTGPRGERLFGIVRGIGAGDQQALLHVYGPAGETERELAYLDRILAATGAGLIVSLVLLMIIQIRFGLSPLRRLHTALSRVRQGTVERIGRGYGPDLDPLAEEMDEVLARNARIVGRARTHAADLSHALKKPLALLAHAGNDGELLRSQVATMSRLIDRYLARAGSGSGEMRRIVVRERIAALLALMRRLHQAHALHWHMDAPATLMWRGEPTDFEEMLGNLLDNAGKWARSEVRVKARAEAGMLSICIEDDGPGLSREQIELRLRRGQRFDESVEGSGLGLAISADIAETYGGTLGLEPSGLGGLRVELQLPL